MGRRETSDFHFTLVILAALLKVDSKRENTEAEGLRTETEATAIVSSGQEMTGAEPDS